LKVIVNATAIIDARSRRLDGYIASNATGEESK
jgi:hypothetical protein